MYTMYITLHCKFNVYNVYNVCIQYIPCNSMHTIYIFHYSSMYTMYIFRQICYNLIYVYFIVVQCTSSMYTMYIFHQIQCMI